MKKLPFAHSAGMRDKPEAVNAVVRVAVKDNYLANTVAPPTAQKRE